MINSVTDGAALSDSTRSAIDRRQPRPSGTEEALPSMSRRKPLAALAAVTAALALAVPVVPAASASAATTAPVARTAFIGVDGVFPFVVGGRLVPGSLPCQILIDKVRFALAIGNPALANLFSIVFIYSGCGGAAI